MRTVDARAGQGHVRRVQAEAQVGERATRHIGEQLGRRLVHPAAVVADEVDVAVLVLGVGRRPVPEMGVPDDAELLEQVQRPVHGRDVHRRCRRLDPGAHLLGCRVPQLLTASSTSWR